MRLVSKLTGSTNKVLSSVSFAPPGERPLWQRYGFSIAVTLGALVITSTFYSLFAPAPFLMFWAAIALSAWFGGFRASLICIVLSILLVNYFFIPPFGTLNVDAIVWVRLAIFGVVGLLISHLYHREALLRKEQDIFRITLSSIGDGVIVTDNEGKVVFLNSTAENLTGWSREAAIDKPIEHIFNIINQRTRQKVENPVKKVLEQGRIVGLANHTMLIDRQGVERPIADSGSPILSVKGVITGAVLVFRDVTPEYEAKMASRESEARFRHMADHAPVLLWMSGTDKLCFYFNQPWLDFRGRTLEQEFGNGWTEGIYPEDYQRCLDTYTSAFDLRQSFTMDYRLRRYDGEYRWVVDNGVPRYTENGEFLGYIGSCIDITERKLVEQQTKSLQALTASLSQAATLEQVAQVIIQKTLSVVNGHIGLVGLLKEDQHSVRILSMSGAPEAINRQFRQMTLDDDYPLTAAIRNGSPVWIESQEEYLKLYPHAAANLAATETKAAVAWPLLVSNRVIGGLGISFNQEKNLTEVDRIFLQTIAYYCAEALERAHLAQQAQEVAALEERNHLARELHDTISQTLFAASSMAQAIPRTWKRDTEKAFAQLETLNTLTRSAYAEMRILLLEMRPEHLLRLPLRNQYEQLAEALQGRKALTVTVEVDDEIEMLPELQPVFYRIAQEALNNVAKHANATEVLVRLLRTPTGIELHINDNGDGFDTSKVSTGMGLTSMQERAKLINASLEIRSTPGEGTQLRLMWTPKESAP